MCDQGPCYGSDSRKEGIGYPLVQVGVSEIRLRFQKLNIQERKLEAEEYSHPLKTRSKKTKILQQLEISFEMGILDSHQKAFLNIFRHHALKLQQILQLSQIKFLKTQPLYPSSKPINHESQLSHIIQSSTFLSSSQKSQFMVDLEHQPELSEFIVYSWNLALQTNRSELIWLFWIIWEQFVVLYSSKFKKVMKNVQDSLSQKLQDLIDDYRLKNLVFLSQNYHYENEIKNEFKRFLEGMALTVGLIIYGYFDNPFEDEEMEYTISERRIPVSDEEQERTPEKHIKKE